MSDTTNLAPAVTGVDLFSHIRHMGWTAFPALILALVFFMGMGITSEPQTSGSELENTLLILEKISPWAGTCYCRWLCCS